MSYNPNNPNGQSTMANSAPVVIASDQSAVPVTVASVPLPSGAATEATLSALNAKLPSIAALADNTSNPTLTQIASFPHLFDGSTWDRQRSVTNAIDAHGPTATGNSGAVTYLYGYNGTDWDRVRTSITDGLLVNLGANNDVTVTSGAITETNSAAIAASLSVLDDWDETNRAAVNTIAGQVGVQGGSGTSTALTQRVVLATDVALPAGTNNIGDVDVLSVVPGTGATNLGKAEDGAHTTGDVGVMALAVRRDTPSATGADNDYMPITTDSNGKVWANAEISAVIPGTGATNLGKAEDAAHTTGDVGVMAMAVRRDTASALGADNDYTPLTTDSIGALHTSNVQTSKVATPTLSNVSASASSVTLLSANTARRQVVLVNDSAAICYVKFGTTASTTSYTVQMPAIASGIASHLFIDEDPVYTGRIDAIWASATGSMRVTEIAT